MWFGSVRFGSVWLAAWFGPVRPKRKNPLRCIPSQYHRILARLKCYEFNCYRFAISSPSHTCLGTDVYKNQRTSSTKVECRKVCWLLAVTTQVSYWQSYLYSGTNKCYTATKSHMGNMSSLYLDLLNSLICHPIYWMLLKFMLNDFGEVNKSHIGNFLSL